MCAWYGNQICKLRWKQWMTDTEITSKAMHQFMVAKVWIYKQKLEGCKGMLAVATKEVTTRWDQETPCY